MCVCVCVCIYVYLSIHLLIIYIERYSLHTKCEIDGNQLLKMFEMFAKFWYERRNVRTRSSEWFLGEKTTPPDLLRQRIQSMKKSICNIQTSCADPD